MGVNNQKNKRKTEDKHQRKREKDRNSKVGAGNTGGRGEEERARQKGELAPNSSRVTVP